ncbi:MAG TPA: hypothetical protein VFO07_10330 [Roseiflexaceae bacterium]|nr:hypothetical protein [Roseiflexaceae bacterium]
MQATLRRTEIRRPAVPLLELLDPREQTRTILVLLAAGVAVTAVAMRWSGLPLWGATVAVLLLLLPPAILKWRDDLRLFGLTAMVISVLLAMQGFHSIEHAAQLIEYHLMNWPMRQSSGLISAANAEWIHFAWNWFVLLVVTYLVWAGMRNPWAWLLLAWSLAHTLEHTYLFVRYLEALSELRSLGVTNVPAQGLPGVLGRDGWLASSDATRGTFLCRLPGLTTAVRLDIHFWWNTGETALMILAANAHCRDVLGLTGQIGRRAAAAREAGRR